MVLELGKLGAMTTALENLLRCQNSLSLRKAKTTTTKTIKIMFGDVVQYIIKFKHHSCMEL